MTHSHHDITIHLEHLSHYLPSQGVLKNFIHHNTLHAFQEESFHIASLRAASLYGAKTRESAFYFETCLKQGKLTQEGMHFVNLHTLPKKNAPQPQGWVKTGIRHTGFLSHGEHIIERVNPIVFRLLATFLDQGISPDRLQPLSFWKWLQHHFSSSRFNFSLLSSKDIQSYLQKSPYDLITELSPHLVEKNATNRYLLELLLSLPGWAGLIKILEKQPHSLFEKKEIHLHDLVAITLLLDYAISKSLSDFSPLKWDKETDPMEIDVLESPEEKKLREAQDALEWSCYLPFLKRIETGRGTEIRRRGRAVQAFFCIDDRECSIRRHLEELDDSISTYGTAGFFGIDAFIKEAGYPYAEQYCPNPITPKHLIETVFPDKTHTRAQPRRHTFHLSRTLLNPTKGFLYSLYQGWIFGTHLISEIFWPRITAQQIPSTDILVDYRETTDTIQLGYTVEEMAQRVFFVLQNAGLQREFSRLVLLIGHQASSTNNPHYAAYDCGACSGRSGANNARAFAKMANKKEVRERISELGILIPSDIYFAAACHDTTQDNILFFDEDIIPETHQELLNKFKETANIALQKNAEERCLAFQKLGVHIPKEKAREHVQKRAHALFEPRPELNHASNALCIVGPRDITGGLSLGRRSFLHSYAPETDPTGDILQNILKAVIPVCGGINLEYYFSRMDSEIYGAGTKLTHNVVGLFAVSNGTEGDLRTGLPSQMTELHDPVRLLVLVNQDPDIAQAVIERTPELHTWIYNEWVHYAVLSTKNHKIYRFKNKAWHPIFEEKLL